MTAFVPPLHGEDARQFQNHVLRSGPAAELSFQVHADQAGHLQLPRHAGHHVHGIGTAHADRQHAQTSRIGSVGIGTHHHAAGKGIVLQHHLMDDSRPGSPETDSVFVGHRAQEVVHFPVRVEGPRQVASRPVLGLDQVVAVHRRGHGRPFPPGIHELEKRHLGRSVLHGHPVGREIDVILSPSVPRDLFRIV